MVLEIVIIILDIAIHTLLHHHLPYCHHHSNHLHYNLIFCPPCPTCPIQTPPVTSNSKAPLLQHHQALLHPPTHHDHDHGHLHYQPHQPHPHQYNRLLVDRPPQAPNVVQLFQSPSAFINIFLLVMVIMVMMMVIVVVMVNIMVVIVMVTMVVVIVMVIMEAMVIVVRLIKMA